jgi:hypothetical protein
MSFSNGLAAPSDTLALTYDLVNVPGSLLTSNSIGDSSRSRRAPTDCDQDLKLLRFSPASGYSDGHSLALLACAMGWLDIIVHMVVCDQTMSGAPHADLVSSTRPHQNHRPVPPSIDPRLRRRARDRVDHYANEFDKASRHVRAATPLRPAHLAAVGLGAQVVETWPGSRGSVHALRTAMEGNGPYEANGEP